MPGAFPGSPNEQDTPTVPSKRVRMAEVDQDATTPQSSAPIEAPTEEMHPKHLHQSTVKPREEARWLGFSNMPPATEPPKRNSKLVDAQGTPSRTTKRESAFKSPDFTFTFRREQSLELSPEAKLLMEEKRAEALRIKDQMKSSGEAAQLSGEALGRKIAQPKGKKSRFSELHDAQFKKMDSIAGHASAYRKDPSRLAPPASTSKIPAQTPSKSLKRSPSKAELDKTEATPSRTIPRMSSKPNLTQPGSQLRRAPSMKNLREAAAEGATPAKRVKRAEAHDVSNARPASNDNNNGQPSTPQHIKDSRTQPSYPDLSHLATPTQSSLARASSVKSTKTASKIPGPGLARSPSKPNLIEPSRPSPKETTPLMSKSPVKGGLFHQNGATASTKPTNLEVGRDTRTDATPKLAKSPAKGGLFSNRTAIGGPGNAAEERPKAMMDAALARTPAKAGNSKPARLEQDNSPSPQKKEPQQPLLARSPLKMSAAKETELQEAGEKQSSIPLLSQSPSKASQNQNPFAPTAPQSPPKTTGSNLMGRFNMLRTSPIKSILRTPQRLYSNDPSKIAAGTHFATPPKFGDKTSKLPGPPPATAPVRKHVDFSSSTKDREATKSSTPSEQPSSPSVDDAPSVPAEAVTTNYPTLPTILSPVVNPTPDRRRKTIAPGDFTFRAGDGIVFDTSSLAPPGSSNRPSTIRHVSAEPEMLPSTIAASQKKRKFDFENKINVNPPELSPTVTPGSKKRKFTFENSAVAKAAEATSTSDKENGETDRAEDEGESRPKKRVKSAAVSSKPAAKPAPKPSSRMPTLGVKPKAGSAAAAKDDKAKKKKSGSISMARLNALAMPKRRG